MKVVFPYVVKQSPLFSLVKRPVAEVSVWSKLTHSWLNYSMLVDTGADYTVFPSYCSVDLGVHLPTECQQSKTSGVGGSVTVFFMKRQIRIKIGGRQLSIPAGFINTNTVPPLLGREACLNFFQLKFVNFHTEFSQ